MIIALLLPCSNSRVKEFTKDKHWSAIPFIVMALLKDICRTAHTLQLQHCLWLWSIYTHRHTAVVLSALLTCGLDSHYVSLESLNWWCALLGNMKVYVNNVHTHHTKDLRAKTVND